MCGGAAVIFHMFRLPAQSFVHTGCCGQGRVKAVSPRTLKEEKEERQPFSYSIRSRLTFQEIAFKVRLLKEN